MRETGTQTRRLTVLISAFACCPASGVRFSGGEDILGWNLVKQVGRFHDAYVLTHAADRTDIEAQLSRERLAGVEFDYVGLPRWLRPLQQFQGGIQLYCYLWQIRAYFRARELIRKRRFDLAHHLTYANDWMASFIGALLPLPFVRGPGGGAHRVPAALLTEFTFVGRAGERLRSVMQQLFRRDLFFIAGQRRARHLLVCNQEALTALPAPWQQKTSLFPVNGVSADDLARLSQSATPQDPRVFRVLSAGKLLRLKGFGLAIKAVKPLCGRYPDLRLEIIGDGPDRPSLERLVDRLTLRGRVQLSSWKPREAFLDALSACDVFLFPSLRDGGGAVVIEAMAAGKPVVCLEIGGPALHVTGDCGIKVSVRSPAQVVADLADALDRLYHDGALREAMGRAARQRAESSYSWGRLGERLAGIYQEALGVKTTRAPVIDTPVLLVGAHGSS